MGTCTQTRKVDVLKWPQRTSDSKQCHILGDSPVSSLYHSQAGECYLPSVHICSKIGAGFWAECCRGAVRRHHIPKPGKIGQPRPVGIPPLEDTVLQRAVPMVLEPIYEQDFLDCSDGFRPGRTAHQALDALWGGLMEYRGHWVIELDIQTYFDDVDRRRRRSFLDQRVRDGVIRRAIGKWINAGVMEDGGVRHPERGMPQGGVISPLSNICLHEVLDLWFQNEVKPRMRERAFAVRFADDAALVFEREDDARRVLDVLPQWFAKYGLRLHPEKARLVDFRSPYRTPDGVSQRAGSFKLLGFTHHWGRSRRGRWVVQRKTAKDRFTRSVRAIDQWCRTNRRRPIREQRDVLRRKLQWTRSEYFFTPSRCFEGTLAAITPP